MFKKQGFQLVAGDIVVIEVPPIPAGFGRPTRSRLLLAQTNAKESDESSESWHVIDLDKMGADQPSRGVRHFDRSREYDVEDRAGMAVSPNEFAALVSATKQLVELDRNSGPSLLDPARRAYLGDLVDRLMPPDPPTMSEMLAALADLAEAQEQGMQAHYRKGAREIIERARRAGMLPKGDAS